MKVKSYLVRGALFCSLLFSLSDVKAISLDGTGGTAVYVAAPYLFSSGDFAAGYVYFDTGFTIPAAGTVTIGIHPPVKLGISLSGTGLMVLTQDLNLAPGASLFAGGLISTSPPFAGTEIAISLLGGAITVISHPYIILGDLVINGNGSIMNVDGPTPAQTFGSQPGFIVDPGVSMVFENVNLTGWSLFPGLDYTPVRFVEDPGLFRSFININLIISNSTIRTLLESTTTYSNCQALIQNTTISGRESTFNLFAPKVIPENMSIDTSVHFMYTPTTRYVDTTFGIDSFAMEVFDRIMMDNCIFTTTVPLKFARGATRVTGVVDFFSTATADSDRVLQIGEQGLSKRCDLDILPGARLVMHDMELKYDNAT